MRDPGVSDRSRSFGRLGEEFFNGALDAGARTPPHDIVHGFRRQVVRPLKCGGRPIHLAYRCQNILRMHLCDVHMSIPKVRDVTSGTSRSPGRQAVSDNEDAGRRIKSALNGREVSWLVRETGYGDSTIRDALRRGPVRSDVAMAIAKALNVSVDWLLSGSSSRSSASVADVSSADWVEVPEYDLRDLTDDSRGSLVSTTPIRRDWLNRTLGQSSGLWLGRLPADLVRLDLREGDLVFLRDVEPGEVHDGAIYIIRLWGHLTVARLEVIPGRERPSAIGTDDRTITLRDIGPDDGQAILVARVLGAPLRRL